MESLAKAKLINELPRVYPRLVAWALRFLRLAGYPKRVGGDIRATAEDLAHDVLLRMFQGTRVWRPERVDLARFLHEAIRSMAHTAAGSPSGRFVNHTPVPREPFADSPEVRLIAAESGAEGARAIVEAAGEDRIVREVAQAMMDGCDKPADIAAHLGIPVAEVYNASRTLRRRVAARFRLGAESQAVLNDEERK